MESEGSMADTGVGTGTTTATKHLTLRCQFCETWNRVDAARAADRPKCGNCGKPMLLDRPIYLNDDTFTRTIEGSDVPVLVDFDADRAQRTAGGFDIRGIPTSIVFKNGKEVARQTGAVPKKILEELLAKAL